MNQMMLTFSVVYPFLVLAASGVLESWAKRSLVRMHLMMAAVYSFVLLQSVAIRCSLDILGATHGPALVSVVILPWAAALAGGGVAFFLVS